MKTLLLTRDMVYTGSLILVNRRYPYRADASGKALAAAAGNILMENKAALIYKNLMDELNGWEHITAVSGWRGRAEQERIYNDSLCENGLEFTRKYVAYPGHSEHQTGLAIDLALNDEEIDFLCPRFPYDGVCGEFRELSVRYGFIERYQRGKEDITGIAHEPWHFRYVGAPHAEIMRKQGFSLEEYHGFIHEFSRQSPLECDVLGRKTKIFYHPADGDITALGMDDDTFLVSGDNMEGFIVTVF